MNKKKIRVVRVSPNKPPIMDEISVSTSRSYIDIKPYGEIIGSEFDGIWLNEDEAIVCYFINTDLALNITEKKMLYQYNGILAVLERNRDVLGKATYGDLIIMADTGRSLTIEEIDEYIEMFRLEDKPSKGVNKYDEY